MKANDALKKNLRALPWLKVEKNYVFTTNDGEKNLVELFQGRSQLFIKHFMMAPGRQWQCVGCSLECDHTNGLLPHLENHDISPIRARCRSSPETASFIAMTRETST